MLISMSGCPIKMPQASQRIGNQGKGTLLLQDINLVDIISHITHERIPERYFPFSTEVENMLIVVDQDCPCKGGRCLRRVRGHPRYLGINKCCFSQPSRQEDSIVYSLLDGSW